MSEFGVGLGGAFLLAAAALAAEVAPAAAVALDFEPPVVVVDVVLLLSVDGYQPWPLGHLPPNEPIPASKMFN